MRRTASFAILIALGLLVVPSGTQVAPTDTAQAFHCETMWTVMHNATATEEFCDHDLDELFPGGEQPSLDGDGDDSYDYVLFDSDDQCEIYGEGEASVGDDDC